MRDAKAEVGSAYGSGSILGCWRTYAENGHGGNVERIGRDPSTFGFSILQRVSPDMEAAEVVAIEASWKERLHCRIAPFILSSKATAARVLVVHVLEGRLLILRAEIISTDVEHAVEEVPQAVDLGRQRRALAAYLGSAKLPNHC